MDDDRPPRLLPPDPPAYVPIEPDAAEIAQLEHVQSLRNPPEDA